MPIPCCRKTSPAMPFPRRFPSQAALLRSPVCLVPPRDSFPECLLLLVVAVVSLACLPFLPAPTVCLCPLLAVYHFHLPVVCRSLLQVPLARRRASLECQVCQSCPECPACRRPVKDFLLDLPLRAFLHRVSVLPGLLDMKEGEEMWSVGRVISCPS